MEGEAEVWSSQGMQTTGGQGAGRGVLVGGSGRGGSVVMKMVVAAGAGIELVGLHRRPNEEWV
jgi:hypothetical protein